MFYAYLKKFHFLFGGTKLYQVFYLISIKKQIVQRKNSTLQVGRKDRFKYSTEFHDFGIAKTEFSLRTYAQIHFM